MTSEMLEQDRDVKHWWIFPYRWNRKKVFSDLWNEKEPRIFPPKQFGIGWGLNFHAVWNRLKRIDKK